RSPPSASGRCCRGRRTGPSSWHPFEQRSNAREVRLGVDAGRKRLRRDAYRDRMAMLQCAQLLEPLGTFQRRRIEARVGTQETGAIRVDADVAQERKPVGELVPPL